MAKLAGPSRSIITLVVAPLDKALAPLVTREFTGSITDADLLGQEPVEQIGIGDRASEFACDKRREGLIERRDVERDDGSRRSGQLRHEPVADFATGPGNQSDGFTHALVML